MGTEEQGGGGRLGALIGLVVGCLPGGLYLASMFAHENEHLGDGTGRWVLHMMAPYLFLVLVALPALLGAGVGALIGRSATRPPGQGKPSGKGDGRSG